MRDAARRPGRFWRAHTAEEATRALIRRRPQPRANAHADDLPCNLAQRCTGNAFALLALSVWRRRALAAAAGRSASSTNGSGHRLAPEAPTRSRPATGGGGGSREPGLADLLSLQADTDPGAPSDAILWVVL